MSSPRHRLTHPEYVPGCGPCRWASVAISNEAMPTRYPRAAQIAATERQWEADGDAYRRLVRNGVQPRDVDGCAVLEKDASDAVEIEMGMTIPFKDIRDRVKEGNQISKDIGLAGGQS